MVYPILKTLIRWGFKVHFKNIYLINEENVPLDKPVLLTPNHSNALIDPIIMGSTFKTDLAYLTRGDIFKGKAVLWLFNELNMLPIFRQRDGVEQMKKNETTFEKCEELMRDKQKLVIFVEGDCIVEKRLRPLKKGMARLAIGSIEKYGRDLDIQIVPVGINYTHHKLFRKEVMVRYGKPIPLSDYYDTLDKNKARAIKAINRDVKDAMHEHIVHIAQDSEIDTVDKYHQIFRNQFKFSPLPVVKHTPQRLDGEIAIANKINDMAAHDKENYQATTEKVNAYFEKLAAYGLDDLGVADTYKNNLWRGIWLLLTLPIMLVGYIGNYLPARIAKWLADTKTDGEVFYTTTYFVGGVLLYTIYFILLSIILGITLGWKGLLAVVVIGVSGCLMLMRKEFFRVWRAKAKFNAFKRKNKTAAEELQKQRQALVQELPVHKTATLQMA